MNSELKLYLVSHCIRGFDRRDPSQTFEETVVTSSESNRHQDLTQKIKSEFADKGYEVTSIELMNNGELREVNFDLQKLYDDTTIRIEPENKDDRFRQVTPALTIERDRKPLSYKK